MSRARLFIIRNIFLALIVIILTQGCALYHDTFHIPLSLVTPEKYRRAAYWRLSSDFPKISKGMTREEVLASWGEPYSVNDLEKIDVYHHSTGEKCGLRDQYEIYIGYNVYYTGNKLHAVKYFPYCNSCKNKYGKQAIFCSGGILPWMSVDGYIEQLGSKARY